MNRVLEESARLNKQSEMYDDIVKAMDDKSMQDYLEYAWSLPDLDQNPITYAEFKNWQDDFYGKVSKQIEKSDTSHKLYQSYLGKVKIME